MEERLSDEHSSDEHSWSSAPIQTGFLPAPEKHTGQAGAQRPCVFYLQVHVAPSPILTLQKHRVCFISTLGKLELGILHKKKNNLEIMRCHFYRGQQPEVLVEQTGSVSG